MEYKFSDIEEKIKQYWKEKDIYRVKDADSGKPKYYVLDMFPYPSGAGLHVGHPLGYIASDIYARYKRMKGFNVLHPMGYDSFGLPAEQYAIQTGQHPAITTEQNIATFRRQMDQLGFSFDWSREVRTSDPKFYKWTQWIFIQLFHSWYNNATNKAERIETLVAELEKNGNKNIKAATAQQDIFTADEWKGFTEKQKSDVLLNYRIAYIADSWVNWCPALGTVLANDEVKDGVSERGGYPVERKLMKQWSMRITAYADRLLKGLDGIDWSDSIKEAQRNWIGKSEGCSVKFGLKAESSPPLLRRGGGGDELVDDEDRLRAYLTGNKTIAAELLKFGKENRRNPTDAEELLWSNLRNKKLDDKFRRQHPIGNFIVDFICISKRLIIKLDGEQHKENKEYDKIRTNILNELGYKVLRFWNGEVLGNAHEVLEKIRTELSARPDVAASQLSILTPNPSPKERGTASAVPENKVLLPTGGLSFIEVFTTRPDTIFGVTFLTLAPEHELISSITTPEYKTQVDAYVTYAKNRSERERMTDVKKVTGQFTGAYATHPFTGQPIPIWIGEYVLAGYGTGAVMGVPGHDSRDYGFAKHFNLDIKEVIKGGDITKEAFEEEGENVNSSFLDGLKTPEAKKKVIDEIEKAGIGKRKVNFKLRDAVFGRQRYWGEPIPIYYDEQGIPYTVDEEDLPLKLPEVDKYLPTEDGEPPLARAKNWNYSPAHTPLLWRGAGGEDKDASANPPLLWRGAGGEDKGASANPSLPGRGVRGEATSVNDETTPGYQTANKEVWGTLKENARNLRKDLTPAEKVLWEEIRDQKLGDKFRRQHPIGNFIADFICLEKRLIIEVDGGIHAQQKEYDEKRQASLEYLGYKVIRFTNEEVLSNTVKVISEIKSNLAAGSPHPRPLSEGEGSDSRASEDDKNLNSNSANQENFSKEGDSKHASATPLLRRGARGEAFPLETTTMPGWAGSSWYYLRYEDPQDANGLASPDKINYWQNIDFYIGGAEHSTGHLIYFRFWTKFLFDLGIVSFEEPAKRLVNQGMIQGVSLKSVSQIFVESEKFNTDITERDFDYQIISSYDKVFDEIERKGKKYKKVTESEVHVPINLADKDGKLYKSKIEELDPDDLIIFQIDTDIKYDIVDGEDEFIKLKPIVEKMSKSKYNVVNPDDIVSKYGADCFRLYEMFLGPLELSKPWDTKGIDGVSRFLRKLWKLFYDDNGGLIVTNEAATNEELKILHKTIKKAEEDMDRLSFNTSVSAFMICVNTLTDLKCHKTEVLKDLLLVYTALLAPFTTEFLWQELKQEGSVVNAAFPKVRAELLVENTFEYPIAINGKTRAKIELPLDALQESIEKEVLAMEAVQKHLEGKTPKKVIVVKGRMVNVVV